MNNLLKSSEEHTLFIASSSDLEAAVRNVLSELLDQRQEEHKDLRISRKAACARLGKDMSTLRRWEKQHMLHPIFIGKCVYYSEHEIELIEQGKR